MKKANISFPDSVRYYNAFEYMFILSKSKPSKFNPIKKNNPLAGKPITSTKRGKDGILKKDSGYINKKVRPKKSIIKNVWKYANGSSGVGVKHPAVFPEQLANDHIISWSNENDLVYDCFMGSGTTAKMSKINNRNWIGSEMSKEYCEIIKQRLK